MTELETESVVLKITPGEYDADQLLHIDGMYAKDGDNLPGSVMRHLTGFIAQVLINTTMLCALRESTLRSLAHRMGEETGRGLDEDEAARFTEAVLIALHKTVTEEWRRAYGCDPFPERVEVLSYKKERIV